MSRPHFNNSTYATEKSGQNINEVQNVNSLNFTKVQVEFCIEIKLKHYIIGQAAFTDQLITCLGRDSELQQLFSRLSGWEKILL